MAFTHQIMEQWYGGGRYVTAQNTFTAGLQISLSESIPEDSTDLEVGLMMPVTALKSIYIKSDQDVTIEINSGSDPDDTIVLVADVPYIWHENSYHACLLTTDIAALFVTNAGEIAATLEIEALYDPTP